MISTNNDMDEFHLESLKMFSHIQRKHSFKTIKIKFDDSEMITVIYIHIELRVDIQCKICYRYDIYVITFMPTNFRNLVMKLFFRITYG